MASQSNSPEFKESLVKEEDDYDEESEEEEEEEEGSGEVATPAAAAHRSVCTASMAKNYAAVYKVPPEFNLCAPKVDQRAHDPPPGYSAIYTDHFLHGLKLPLPAFVIAALTYYKIALTQLHPSTIPILLGFMDLCNKASVAPTTSLFRHFFRLRRNRNFKDMRGWYSFMAKSPKIFHGQRIYVRGWEKSFLFFKTAPLLEEVDLSWNFSSVVDLPLAENEIPSAQMVRKLKACVKGKGSSSKRKRAPLHQIHVKPEEDDMKTEMDVPVFSLRKSSRTKKSIQKFEPASFPRSKASNATMKPAIITIESLSAEKSGRQKKLRRLAGTHAMEPPKTQQSLAGKKCMERCSQVPSSESLNDMAPEKLTLFIKECVGSLHLKHQEENEKLKNQIASLKGEVSRLQAVVDDRGPLLKVYTWKLLKTRAFAEFFCDITTLAKSLGCEEAAKRMRDEYPSIPEEALKSLEDPLAASKLDNMFFEMIQDDGFKIRLLDHLLSLEEIPNSSELKHLDVDEDQDALIPPPPVSAT